MPAPDKSFTLIPDSDVDPDSPVTTGLMTALRDNDQHLQQYLAHPANFTPTQSHNHDGTNSAIVALTGASLNPGHDWEIFDHFIGSVLDTNVWTQTTTGTGAVAYTQNQHYASFSTGLGGTAFLTGNAVFRIDQVSSILEFRARTDQVSTNWDGDVGLIGSSRWAKFFDSPTADDVRCQTIGSGGTQNTDVAVGGGGDDTWHKYKIDQTLSSSTKFYLDDTLVATHSTAVPDAQDLSVKAGLVVGGNNLAFAMDWVKFWITAIVDSTH